ncbi:MAG: tetratricopeptide (TPR) repeat protein [Motiliproteus sp.]
MNKVINVKIKMLIVSLLAANSLYASASEYDNIKILINDGRSKNAMASIDRLLENNQADKRALLLKGYLLHSTEKLDQAQRVYERLIQLDPNMPETYNNLGVLFAEKGDKENATRILISTFDTNPAYAAAYSNLRGIFNEIAANTYREILKGGEGSSVQSTFKLTLLKDSEFLAAESTAIENLALAALNEKESSEPTPVTPKPVPTAIATTPIVTPDVQPKTDTRGIIDLITNWSLAWSSQNPDLYLSYYQDNAIIEPGISRARWEKNRRSRILSPEYIQVTIDTLDVSLENTESATASFKQTYRASNYQDVVFKKMTFIRSGEDWKILQEQAL